MSAIGVPQIDWVAAPLPREWTAGQCGERRQR